MREVSKVYIWQDSDTGEISISAYQADDPEWESNHMKLVELRNGKVNKHESVLTILRNVLAQTGVQVVFD